jgi:hypothetical protein
LPQSSEEIGRRQRQQRQHSSTASRQRRPAEIKNTLWNVPTCEVVVSLKRGIGIRRPPATGNMPKDCVCCTGETPDWLAATEDGRSPQCFVSCRPAGRENMGPSRVNRHIRCYTGLPISSEENHGLTRRRLISPGLGQDNYLASQTTGGCYLKPSVCHTTRPT